MNIIKYFINLIRNDTPKNPNEFVKKFIKDSKKERAQLELIYDDEIILQVDALNFVPSWFKITNKSAKDFKNGYVIFFSKNTEDFYGSHAERELNHLEKDDFIKIEETYDNLPVTTVAKFVSAIDNYLSLANEMKDFVNKFYRFKERDPSILFNIRYLPNLEG